MPFKTSYFCAPMRRLLLILLIINCTLSVFAQDNPRKIELLHANELQYDERQTGKVRRLLGNVQFKHDDALMFCDSAWLYSETNTMDAFSRVHINQGDTLDLFGDKLNYNGNTKVAVITGNVKLIDKEITLTTDRLTYDRASGISNYTTGGKIVQKEDTLTSIFGYYYSGEKMLHFRKNVVLINPKYTINCDTLKFKTTTEVAYFLGPTVIVSDENTIYCENGWYDTRNDVSQFNRHAKITSKEQTITGDSIYYDRANGFGKAINNIILRDTVQKVVINGDYGEFFRSSEKTIVTGKALMKQNMDGDTLYLHADTLKTTLDTISEKRTLFAYHKAKFFKSDFQGMCDSLVYSYKDSAISMYYFPILWNDSNQLTADTTFLQMANGKMHEMRMRNNSFIISSEDTAHFNQIKGKNMNGFFRDSKLYKVRVIGNGQTVYYAKEEGKPLENVNKAESSDMLIFVDSNRVKSITFITKPDATLYPLKEVAKEDLKLKDFSWKNILRPRRIEDVFKWD